MRFSEPVSRSVAILCLRDCLKGSVPHTGLETLTGPCDLTGAEDNEANHAKQICALHYLAMPMPNSFVGDIGALH